MLLATIGLGAVQPASAIPPPIARPDGVIELTPDGPEQWVRDTVRAYQAVPVAFTAQAGDRLMLRLVDGDGVLVLGTEAPSGLAGVQGARPGPDGLVLQLGETGAHRLIVSMSADAARTGRASSFVLGLRLRR